MIPLDFSGKTALVTGVGDTDSFAWHISKVLRAAGAKLIWSVHPRMINIVQGSLERDMDAEARKLPNGAGDLTVDALLPCDVGYDTMEDVPEEIATNKKFNRHGDFSIKDMMETVKKDYTGIDFLIHSVAFSREIIHKAIDTSRKGYLEALSISAYSLTSLCRAAQPLMENRAGGASVVGLTYIGGDRVVPHYGGGMSTAKAALQIDAKQLAHNMGTKNIRVNLISAGPYPSRAAKAINPDFDKLVEYAAERSLIPRAITPEEVANATLFLCSPLASAVTGHVLYVDCGYNVFGL
ncbi:MAG: SDR family oxidoreductase [Gemmataceae bacterium]